VYLQNNAIASLGAGLADAKFARLIRLDGNRLAAADGLDKCFSLTELDLSNNMIASLKVCRTRSLS
jgi:Leucine-rich repeat (LRR) protein